MGPHDYTGLLYSQPSFLEGVARTLDVSGGFDDYNGSSTDEKADRLALTSDWYAVGADLFGAISRFSARNEGRSATNGKPTTVR